MGVRAKEIARRSGTVLRVITVHQRLAFGSAPVVANAPAASANAVFGQQLREAHEAALADASESGRVEGIFESGDAVEVLLAQSAEVGLMVAGSRGYGPIGAVLLGGTTHELLRSAQCPLIVTPRGGPPKAPG